jgi:hypothetical protein
VRHLLFVKPDVLIVIDDIAVEGERDLELRFHPEATRAEQKGQGFLIRGEKAALRIDLLTPDGVTLSAEDVAGEGRHGGEFSMFTVRLATRRAAWRNAVALSWSPGADEPPAVSLRTEADTWSFQVGDRSVDLDWRTGEARTGA